VTLTQGFTGFFTPHPSSWWGSQTPLGAEQAAFYSTAPLRQTLGGLIDSIS
jgi:NTE family protein